MVNMSWGVRSRWVYLLIFASGLYTFKRDILSLLEWKPLKCSPTCVLCSRQHTSLCHGAFFAQGCFVYKRDILCPSEIFLCPLSVPFLNKVKNVPGQPQAWNQGCNTCRITSSILLLVGTSLLKGTCVPFHRETFEINFELWNMISDHSRCESSNQICHGASRSRKGHSVSLFTGKP